MKFFWYQGIFFVNFDFKNGCKNKFEDNNENHADDSKIGSPLKIHFKAEWTLESIPTAWELKSEKISSFGNREHQALHYKTKRNTKSKFDIFHHVPGIVILS